jgi:hypothetical protein
MPLRRRLLLLLAATAPTHAGGAIVGFHLDDERCNTDTRFGNRSTLEPVCIAVLDEYKYWAGNLSGTGLVLSVDTGACAASAPCFNVSWGGASKQVHEHVIDTVNESVVMDYVDSASAAVSYEGRGAAWLLSYASTFDPPRPVRLGLAVREPGAPRTWWQADNISALDALLAGVMPLAEKFRSFDGLAVFHTALWRASALAGPPSPSGNPGRGLRRLAGWYVPDEAIFNGTYQQLEFLRWAQATNISLLYAQNYVGNSVAIPGVSNNTAAFCSFIQMAHRAGVDVHLFGALPQLHRDLAFIAGCEMPPRGNLPPTPPAPTPCQTAIAESCGAVQASTKGFCRRCLLEHLGALVGAGCNDTELTAETICAGAVDGRNHNASACDRAFTAMCGAVANALAPCEECVIDHAAEFIVGWGCGGDITGFCDQQPTKTEERFVSGRPTFAR